MRKHTTASAVFIAFLVVSTPQVNSQSSPVQRDPQALTILAQTIVAGGGVDLLTSIQDLTGVGTVTYYTDEQTTGNVTVKSRGLSQLRMDADLPDGRRTTVVNGIGGALIQEDGSFRPISGQSAGDIGSIVFPYLTLMAAIQDSSTSIIYSGRVNHNGASAYDVRVQKNYPVEQDPQGNRSAREARDFYIDPSSFSVVSIADQIFFGDLGNPHEVLYSNYQPQSGVYMPMTVAETVNAVPGVAIQLTQVTFNSGLSDSDFQW